MYVDTIRSIFKFDPYLIFIDPSQECPGVSSGTPKLKMFSMYLGIQKHFQTFVPRNWSRDLQAGPLLEWICIFLQNDITLNVNLKIPFDMIGRICTVIWIQPYWLVVTVSWPMILHTWLSTPWIHPVALCDVQSGIKWDKYIMNMHLKPKYIIEHFFATCPYESTMTSTDLPGSHNDLQCFGLNFKPIFRGVTRCAVKGGRG